MDYKVVHLKREPYDIRCDRQSIYGNPFVLKSEANRDHVIQAYRKWLWQQIQESNGIDRLLVPLIEAKNKKDTPLVLGCWCAPKPCHCDVLVRACEWYERTVIKGK